MNFRESYKKDNEMIKPDDDFVKQLTEQLKAKEKRHLRKPWINVAAVLAVILIAGLMGYQLLLPSDKPVPREPIPNQSGVASGSGTHGFSPEEDKKQYERLVSCMETEMEYLEKSRTADFTETERVPEADTAELLEKMKGMTYREKDTEPSKEIVFYRVHSRRGENRIFTLEQGQIVRIDGCTGQLYEEK